MRKFNREILIVVFSNGYNGQRLKVKELKKKKKTEKTAHKMECVACPLLRKC